MRLEVTLKDDNGNAEDAAKAMEGNYRARVG
jgi:hypothetical protein